MKHFASQRLCSDPKEQRKEAQRELQQRLNGCLVQDILAEIKMKDKQVARTWGLREIRHETGVS